jgi:hypothetical protein
LLTNLPLFSFALLTAGDVPAGSYKLGYACTLNGAVVKFWDKTFTFTADGVDPLGVVWGAAAVGSTTTTTTSSTTSTTTTVAGSSTSAASSSTSALASSTSEVASSSSAVSSSSSVVESTYAFTSSTVLAGGDGGGLVNTGADPTSWVVWGLIALVLGRIVVLIARRVRIVPPDQK